MLEGDQRLSLHPRHLAQFETLAVALGFPEAAYREALRFLLRALYDRAAERTLSDIDEVVETFAAEIRQAVEENRPRAIAP